MSEVTHLCIDIETLATEDRAVMLALAAVPFRFEADKDACFEDIYSRSDIGFVKFNRQEQIDMGRVVNPGTVEFWKKQPKEVIDMIVKPSDRDLTLFDGLTAFNKYVMELEGFNSKQSYIFQRGTMDDRVIANCYKQIDKKPPFSYNRVRDIRTVVDLLSGSHTGYCDVDAEIPSGGAHDPVWDCARDIMMMLHPTEVN